MGEKREASAFPKLAGRRADEPPDPVASSRIHSNLAAPVNAAVALSAPGDESDTREKPSPDVEINERDR